MLNRIIINMLNRIIINMLNRIIINMLNRIIINMLNRIIINMLNRIIINMQASTYMNGELLDESHVWILPQYYHPEWWEVERYDSTPLHSHSFTPCSPADMRRNLNHVLSVGSLNYNVQHRDYSDDTEVYHLVCVCILLL